MVNMAKVLLRFVGWPARPDRGGSRRYLRFSVRLLEFAQ